MIIPHAAPRTVPYRCQCGYHGKVRIGSTRVTCPKCARSYGKPEEHRQNQEMARRVLSMSKAERKAAKRNKDHRLEACATGVGK